MKRLQSILLLVFACSFMLQAKNYVVCVGLADYPGKKNDLLLSANDARTIGQVFKRNGDSEVLIITNGDAFRFHVLDVMKTLYEKANDSDAIVFFFSGHGMPGSFVCYDGFLKYNEIVQIMKQSKAHTKIVFADACFAGKARKEQSHSESDTKNENVLFFLSSRSKEQSIENRKWKNSLFTTHLTRGLRGGADNDRNRQITARELFLFVSQGVAKASRNLQHPVMWGKFDSDMVIMNWKKE